MYSPPAKCSFLSMPPLTSEVAYELNINGAFAAPQKLSSHLFPLMPGLVMVVCAIQLMSLMTSTAPVGIPLKHWPVLASIQAAHVLDWTPAVRTTCWLGSFPSSRMDCWFSVTDWLAGKVTLALTVPVTGT